MGKQSNGKLIAGLPMVLVATFVVVVVPMVLVFWLREAGVVTSIWVGTAVGVATSLLASQGAAWLWKKRHGSDVLFSELMLWGWVQRWRSERRMTAAADLLGLSSGRPQAISGGRLTNAQKSDLLTHLTSSLEARDQYTHGHSRRVARHAANIAKHMGCSRDEVAKVRAAGAMHDVGKVDTPIAVLHKEGKLSDEEYAIVKRHPVDGAVMVEMLDDVELTAMVRHHHERLDGTGYPDGLAGEEIPLGARILAVADTFDAITSTRPYRHAHAHKKALDILAAEAGTQLDPDAVRAFRSCYSGRRPLAYWTILANSGPRLVSWVGGGLSPASAASAMATIATTAAVGAASVGPIAAASPKAPHRVADSAGVPGAGSGTATTPRPPSRGRFPWTPVASFHLQRDPNTADRSRAGESSDRPGSLGKLRPTGSATAPAVARDQTQPPRPDIPAPAISPSPVATPVPVGQQGGQKARRHGSGNKGHKGRGHGKAKGQSNGKAKGQSNGKAKGQANGNAKGQANGNAKGQANGNAKGQSNGNAKGHGQDKATGQGYDNANRPGDSQRKANDGAKDHGKPRPARDDA